MSRWRASWDAWCARLESVAELAKFYAAGQGLAEYHGASNATLIPNARELFGTLKAFDEQHRSALPPEAGARLSQFVQGALKAKTFERDQSILGFQGASYLIGLLWSVRAEMGYLLADSSDQMRRDVERALLHLQRSIVANEQIRGEWQSVFPEREEHSEALGAVHLLQHGIWAFKVDGITGGRTDLVLGGAVQPEHVSQSGSALVLTEWKMVRAGDDAAKKAHEAQLQAEKYSSGPLAGIELATTRYVVLVSERALEPLPDLPGTERAKYFVRNIAVDPELPSVLARRTAKAATSSTGHQT